MNIRHGDMALIGVDALPDGLKPSSSKILLTGSGGNPHTFDKGVFYPTPNSGQIVGYLVSQAECKLFHKDHGKTVEGSELREALVLPGIYQVRRQVEDTHEGIRAVED